MQNLALYLTLNKGINVSTPTESKTIDSKGNSKTQYKIKGVASTTSIDRDNEIVSKECLKKMADQIKTKRLPIFGNHEHNWENMLGYAVDADLEGNNLWIDIQTAYKEAHPKIEQLIGGLEAGLPLSLSIGGKVKKSHTQKILGKDVNTIDEVDLLETSVVGIGANPDAFVTLDRVTKFFKGEDKMDEINKSSGQAGEASYGKLGETTPQARCPSCGKPSELRGQQENVSVYHCHDCGIQFSVEGNTKDHGGEPTNNVPSPNTPRIDEPPKLRMEGKSVEIDVKGDEMADMLKAKKEAEAEACNKASDDEAEEKEYAKFKSRYARMKAEGIDTVPGGDNAKPANTIGGSGGAATPVHQKSVKEFESMQKAFVENNAIEGLEKSSKENELGEYNFLEMRKSFFGRK